jgi:anaerobic ribonucleoside-triphosphate reductase activating protein
MEVKNLRIFRRQSPVKVLGPFSRAVIWLQGCYFGCRNCIVPESWDQKAGDLVNITELADWILGENDIEGITLSGGEPMLQAENLAVLIDSIKQKKDLGIVCYTGYKLEHILKFGSQEQRLLLTKIDLLIDGLYKEELHADLKWRGSTNQRLLPLTKRYYNLVKTIINSQDNSDGLEFFVDNGGNLSFNGVPNQPNFRQEFEEKMLQKGIILK